MWREVMDALTMPAVLTEDDIASIINQLKYEEF